MVLKTDPHVTHRALHGVVLDPKLDAYSAKPFQLHVSAQKSIYLNPLFDAYLIACFPIFQRTLAFTFLHFLMHEHARSAYRDIGS